MTESEHIHKLAEVSGKAESKAMHKFLENVMTEEEARFMLEMPAPNKDLAGKFNMTEEAVERKILNLAQRGLISPSEKGEYRFNNVVPILHDNVFSSRPEHIPEGLDKLWLKMYDGEKLWHELSEMYGMFEAPILRVIPAERSVSTEIELLEQESITKIIEANQDLITIRDCCCRNSAKKCHHPLDVCMQFKARAEYDLFRGSGRKVSTDEAVTVALTAVGAGLIPTVTNISATENLEFICFCCGCACLVLDPSLRGGNLPKILSPSRFEAVINYEACNGCKHCVPRCQVGAIEMKPIPGHDTIKAVLDPDKCVGCGVCDLACVPGAITMDLVRKPEFIPEAIADESVVHL
ncbi:MAG: 4Fe-4S dicluster domain-containing protein [Deltaproteobacteria bacterium]|nr:4Fe-4S dicluster domain-containing protein [Deltaproteobacteria bacterium]